MQCPRLIATINVQDSGDDDDDGNDDENGYDY